MKGYTVRQRIIIIYAGVVGSIKLCTLAIGAFSPVSEDVIHFRELERNYFPYPKFSNETLEEVKMMESMCVDEYLTSTPIDPKLRCGYLPVLYEKAVLGPDVNPDRAAKLREVVALCPEHFHTHCAAKVDKVDPLPKFTYSFEEIDNSKPKPYHFRKTSEDTSRMSAKDYINSPRVDYVLRCGILSALYRRAVPMYTGPPKDLESTIEIRRLQVLCPNPR